MNIKLLFFIVLITISSIAQNKNKTIGFKENKGQIIDQKGKPNNAVKYLLNSGGLNVQLRKNGFSYDVYEAKKHPIKNCKNKQKKPLPFPSKDNQGLPDYTLEYKYHRIDIDFVNSNPKVELVTEQKSKDYDNYYNIPNKPEGIVGVHQYQQITYKNIYPNIDVVFTIPNDPKKTVEYNFVVHPKGKISDIQLKFSGAQTELIDNKIRMTVRFGEMEETLPASWTEDGQSKKDIAVGYTKIKKNVYGFATSENVTEKTLVIDPVPVRLWGTYYGGAQTDYITEANNDLLGNLLITGSTFSRDNFSTAGAFIINHYSTQPSSFEPDGYIAKFDANGQRIWGTYLNAVPNDIDVDSDNNIISSGYAYNFNTIGTVGTLKPTKQLYNFDGYVLKLDQNGTRKWGTFYGDTGEDIIYSAVVDINNNIIVTGSTGSTINIATPETHKATKNDYSSDAFLAKINPNGQRIWGTYYGGDSDDKALSIAIDKNNNTYIVGETFSSGNIAFGSSNQMQLNNNSIDGFIASFDPEGKIIFGTYHGGNKNDYFNKIDFNNDKLLVSGKTFSTNNIATSNAPYPIPSSTINSNATGIFSIFNKNGTLEMGSYFDDVILDSGFGNDKSIFINGVTYKIGIGTSNSYQPNLSSSYNQDSFIVKFNSNYVKDWGTYYGGNDLEFESMMHIDKINNFIYIGGRTTSTNKMSSNNAYQTSISGREDLFLGKFKDCISTSIVTANTPICTGNTLNLSASDGVTFAWTGPNGFTSTDKNSIIQNATPLNSGKYYCNIAGTDDCDGVFTVDVIVGDTVAPIPNLTTLPLITGDCHTTITTIPTATDACSGAITATTTSPLYYSLPGTYTVVWDYDDGNGNISHQNQTVTINSQPLPTAASPQPFCIQQNATLNSITITTGQNIKWYDQLTAGNLLLNTTLLEDSKTYYASQTINGCESERIAIEIKIQDTPSPTGNANQPFCSGQNPTLANITIAGQDIKWYDALTNENLLPNTTALQDGITYYASQTLNSCESELLAVTISIQNTPGIPTGDTNPKFCKSEKATLNNININGQNLKWYDSNTSANPLANTTLVQNNTAYYVSQTIGCESDRLAVLVNVNDTSLPIANTPQSFCIDENATISNIAITGQNLIWYDNAVAGNILTNNATLENRTYYVTQNNNNCESEKLPVVIKIQNTQVPIADANQSFCIQQNAIINTIKINGQNIKWYNAMTDGMNLSESTPLQNGIIYYASQTISNCESERIPITIEIQETTTADCINFIDELPYPKFFTPNNDRYNDTWTIDFAYLAPNTGIRIFDRYGKLIKVINIDQVWDGTFNGYNLPSSDYWFVVTRLNGAEFKSHFSLKR